jgi:hypothetical protein
MSSAEKIPSTAALMIALILQLWWVTKYREQDRILAPQLQDRGAAGP